MKKVTVKPSRPMVIRVVVRSWISIRFDIMIIKTEKAGERHSGTEDKRQWGI